MGLLGFEVLPQQQSKPVATSRSLGSIRRRTASRGLPPPSACCFRVGVGVAEFLPGLEDLPAAGWAAEESGLGLLYNLLRPL